MGFAMASSPGGSLIPATRGGRLGTRSFQSGEIPNRILIPNPILPSRSGIRLRIGLRDEGEEERSLLARLALYLIPPKSALNAFANFDFSFGRCPDRNHARRSHIADAHCLQRTGPLPTTRRARESRELEGVADRGTDRGGGPGDGRNALSLFHARNR